MADIIIAKRLIDFVGLNVKGPPESYQRLFKDVALVLALNEAMGPDGAQLLQVDSAGRLIISTGSGGGVNVIDDPALGSSHARVLTGSDGFSAAFAGLMVLAQSILFDGANEVRGRSASAANVGINQSALGGHIVARPSVWSVTSNPAVGTAASASRAGGGGGAKHVLQSITAILSSQIAVAAGAVVINVRDGASGGGTILETYTIQLSAAIITPIVIVLVDLDIPGSGNTPMTVEGSAGYANLGESITMRGYDVA